jgi:glutamyl-tRNA synthetase
MPGLKERAKTLVELIDSARYLYADRPLPLDEKAEAQMTPEARAVLSRVARDLAMVEPWGAEGAEAAVRAFAERSGAKLGAIAQPLRVALTGRTTSPGIFDVLAVLGKAESLARIADQAIGPAEGLSAAR